MNCEQCGKYVKTSKKQHQKRFCSICNRERAITTTNEWRKSGREVEERFALTQQEVADKLGYTKQYINIVERSALRKFKRNFKRMYPDTWPIIKDELGRGHFGIGFKTAY